MVLLRSVGTLSRGQFWRAARLPAPQPLRSSTPPGQGAMMPGAYEAKTRGFMGYNTVWVKVDESSILDGPFIAFRFRTTLLGTIAGLKVNEDCQVLREETGEPIESLYAVGEAVYGNLLQHYNGGWGIGSSLVIGHIAGEHAKKAIIG